MQNMYFFGIWEDKQ